MKAMIIIWGIVLSLVLSGCQKQSSRSDAYGHFDATQVTLSAEATGKVNHVGINEGQIVDAGILLAVIDSTDLLLKRTQLLAQKAGVLAQLSSLLAQAAVFDQQRRNLETDLNRIEKLRKDGAATDKQWDDITGAIDLVIKQKTSVLSQGDAVREQARAIDAQLEQVNENLQKCQILSPLRGTILARLIEPGELVVMGKPVFKIANLEQMTLKVYVSGSQLSGIKLGSEAAVLIDQPDKQMKTMKGKVSWISSQAEFTPKVIQTREERVNMVYAVELLVENDGFLKIGMPAEVKFAP